MSDKYIKKGSLSVSTDLEAFLKSEVLPGLDLTEDHFWTSLENIINELNSYKYEKIYFIHGRNPTFLCLCGRT